MAGGNADGRVELEFNADRTQIYITVYPARAAGRSVTTQDVLERLREMGVIYGFREEAIIKAVRYADETGMQSMKVVAAQGILPETGTDAQLIWKVDAGLISSPLPRRPDGLMDYFSFDIARKVVSGQILASVIPAHSGTPGATLTAPLREVPWRIGREVTLQPGEGVQLSCDRKQFLAACDGFLELRGDCLSVHALEWIPGDLDFDNHEFAGGVIVLGGVKGGVIKAPGVVAVRGTVAGATIRSRSCVFVSRAARTKIISDGNIYVLGTLLHCEIITPRKLIALDGATVKGGYLVAGEGVEAVELGAPDSTETRVEVGVDRFSQYRLDEVEEEIKAAELNVHTISQALRPLTTLSAETMPEWKKKLLRTLVVQRCIQEKRVGELHNEKRTLMMRAKSRLKGNVIVSGTVHPGVTITLHNAVTLVEKPLHTVRFEEDATGRSVVIHSQSDAKAA